jgi:murein DD-endopeptidase MepM/ murein hydrolase activator NlpD
MGSSTTDIVARLMLNGSQFSSENARLFGSMEATARDTAGRTKAAFETSFNNIQELAQKGLAMPRNAGGSIDLNVTGAREAAAAAQAQAQALREISAAAERAALKTGDVSENTRLYVQAAKAAALEAEHVARGAGQEAAALEHLQAELNQTASSTQLVIQGNRVLNQVHDNGVVSSGQLRAGYQQLSFQISDVAQSFASGVSPMVIFGQQASQVVQAFALMSGGGQGGGGGGGGASGAASAVEDMGGALETVSGTVEQAKASTEALAGALGAGSAATEGNSAATGANSASREVQTGATVQATVGLETNTVATGANAVATEGATVATTGLALAKQRFVAFLLGPWGAAAIGAVTILGLLASKYEAVGDEVEKASGELEKQAHQADLTNEAQRRFGQSLEGVTAAINDQREALEGAAKSQQEMERQALDDAENRRKRIVEIRKETVALLEKAQAARQAAMQPTVGGEFSIPGQTVAATDRVISDLDTRLARANEALAKAEAAVRGASMPVSNRKVTMAMDEEAAAAWRLTNSLEALRAQRDAPNGITAQEYERRRLVELRRNEAEVKAIRDRQQKDRRESRTGPDGDLTSFVSPVAGARTGQYGEQRRGHRHGGIDIAVPVGTPVSAAAGGVVIESGMVPGYGNVVYIDHGRGTVTRYAHLSQLLVKKGDAVGQGERIGLSGGAKGAEGAGNSQGPHLHYEVRRSGKPVDPGKGQFPTDALATSEKGAKSAKEEADARDRILKASQDQLSVEVEGMRYLGLRLRGLDEQAGTEEEISKLRRESADRMAELTEGERDAQAKVTEGLSEQLKLFRQQSAAYAELLVAAGDQASRTDAQNAALEQANAALLAQRDTVIGLAKTEADRLLIGTDLIRIEHQLNAAKDQGLEIERERAKFEGDAKQQLGEAHRAMEELENDRRDREQDNIRDLAGFYRDAFRSGGKSIVEDFKDEMLDAIAMVAARWTLALLSGQQTSLGDLLAGFGTGPGTGGRGGGGVLSALGLLGNSGSTTAAAPKLLGLGSKLGGAGAGAGGLGGLLGSASAATPYAAAAAAWMAASEPLAKMFGVNKTAFMLAPGATLLAKLFGIGPKPKTGSAAITGTGAGAIDLRGNNSDLNKQASGLAGNVQEGLKSLADQLHAELGAFNVSIGVYKDTIRVNPSGGATNGANKGFTDFGTDQQKAIEFAIADAVRDGALLGISQASQNILKSGQDMSQALAKALMIEDIPKRLAAYIDPVGYAVDQLNAKWKKAIDALKEGGASAEQMADAQKLYKIELEQTKTSAREASADLKDFLAALAFGSGSPYSLRDQEAMARTALDPYFAKIAAGETIDQGKYTEAAQSFLEIERQLYGSTEQYFASMDMIQAATGKAISAIDNAKPIRTVSDPFAEATAANTATGNELLSQVSEQLGTIAQILANIQSGGGGGGGGFIGDGRNFTAAA